MPWRKKPELIKKYEVTAVLKQATLREGAIAKRIRLSLGTAIKIVLDSEFNGLPEKRERYLSAAQRILRDYAKENGMKLVFEKRDRQGNYLGLDYVDGIKKLGLFPKEYRQKEAETRQNRLHRFRLSAKAHTSHYFKQVRRVASGLTHKRTRKRGKERPAIVAGVKALERALSDDALTAREKKVISEYLKELRKRY